MANRRNDPKPPKAVKAIMAACDELVGFNTGIPGQARCIADEHLKKAASWLGWNVWLEDDGKHRAQPLSK